MTKDKIKNKTNLLFMLIVIFWISLIACISSLGLVTWARYRAVDGGNLIAQIAKWSFKVNGASEDFSEIDLAKTISFEHVAKTKIAPGTSGLFDLIIDGSESEVSLDYYIDIDVSQKPTNMKFYSDASFNNELIINEDNKIQLEDEILLVNINTPVTQTIYWKWEYRTKEMPDVEVLTKYSTEVGNLVTEYNTLGKTDIEKQAIALKINDKIDTLEAGGNVLLEVKVTGIQKYPEGFKAKNIYVTSTTTSDYVVGDTATLAVEFTEGVYADNNKTPITVATAPVLKLEFEELTTANNPVAKIATLVNTQLKIATGTERIATFVSVDKNKLNYEYTIQEGDKGNLKVLGLSGTIYNKKGVTINLEKKDISGETITAVGQVVSKIKIGTETITLTPQNASQYYGKEIVYSDNSNRKYRLFYVDFDNKYKEGYGTIYIKADWISCNVNLRDYANYITTEFEIMKKINPKWNEIDGIINSPNEKAVSWLLDKTQWENCINRTNVEWGNEIKYAVGSPSLELYLDSYNQSFNTSINCLYGTNGYYIQSEDVNARINDTGNNSISSEKNEMYIGTGTNKHVWISSMSEPDGNHVYNTNDWFNSVNGSDIMLYGPYGICPVIIVNSKAVVELK